VRRGAHVQATDGRVGRVDEFVVDPLSHRITDLVMREGHLWGTKTVSIPVEQIDEIEEKTVYLKLDKAGVEKLPTIDLQTSLVHHA
jgi:sporulation protein YlmC with PRC-barrel domain